MKLRGAVMAAALMVQGVAGQAQDHAASAQAVFTFAGQSVSISPRAADAAKYAGRFAMLAPSCDPFCIAPSNAADGIETLVEGQVLEFLVTAVAANTGLLVDARMPQGRALGFIPGSVSMPFETLAPENEFRDEILKALGARAFQDVFNFADAQNLVIFDSGPTQNDAGVLIAHLLEAGYPPDKIRYYRGGMQVWSVVGLTVQE